ncbi:MAG: phosphoribosyl-ATP diphosphatase [Thermodesulfobacteriota bacterium]
MQYPKSTIIDKVYKVIIKRKEALPERSYVASLYKNGLEKILEKVEEESSELLEASRDGGKREIIHETADLWFHVLILLGEKGITPDDIYRELENRFGRSGIEEKEARKK